MKQTQIVLLSLLVFLLITGCNNESSQKSKWKNPLIESIANSYFS